MSGRPNPRRLGRSKDLATLFDVRMFANELRIEAMGVYLMARGVAMETTSEAIVAPLVDACSAMRAGLEELHEAIEALGEGCGQ